MVKTEENGFVKNKFESISANLILEMFSKQHSNYSSFWLAFGKI